MSASLQEIKDKIDSWIGIKSVLKVWESDPDNSVEIDYCSPNGILLVTISLQRYRDSWHLGSRSLGIPTGIDELRKLVETIELVKVDNIFQSS